MRISDWSSDVCSSDLAGAAIAQFARFAAIAAVAAALLCYVLLPLAGDYGSFVVLMGLFMMPIAAWSVSNPLELLLLAFSSEERRVGNECVRTSRSRW